MAFTTARLLDQIKLKGDLPYGKFTDAEILDAAYDCLLSEIVPMIIEAREEFYVTYQDITVVENQAEYDIPYRGLNGVLREVKLLHDTSIIDLDRITLEDITDTTVGIPNSFYISGNSVFLYPTPTANLNKTLRLYYFIRPSKFVPVSECAIITSISGNSVNVTIPSSWTTSNTFDLVRGKEHFDILSKDLVASSCSGGVISFTSDVSSKLSVGDYVCLAGESCFPFLPVEGHVSLIQSTVASLLEAIGDPQASSMAEKARFLRESFQGILKLRCQGETSLGQRIL